MTCGAAPVRTWDESSAKVYTAADRAELVALACALPTESDVPLSTWSCPELARELAACCHPTPDELTGQTT